MPGSAGSAQDPLTRPQRMVAGLFLLLTVDVIWVASSEFTGYIFHDLHFDKPFFTTYFKTSLFMVYLTGFLFHRPWRVQLAQRGRITPAAAGRHARYARIADEEGNNSNSDDGGDGSGDENRTLLGSPVWVPTNMPSESNKSSDTNDSESEIRPTAAAAAPSSNGSSSRRVRFKDVAQVVEMDPADALYANLARLSYSASLRARAALERAASKLSVEEVLKLALLFCVPWFIGNYSYQAALSHAEAAIVNVLSSSSCLFTLVLSAIFPSEAGDRFTASKLFAVLFSMCGVMLVCYSDLRLEGGFPTGALWTLSGSFFYSVYIVLLRRSGKEQK